MPVHVTALQLHDGGQLPSRKGFFDMNSPGGLSKKQLGLRWCLLGLLITGVASASAAAVLNTQGNNKDHSAAGGRTYVCMSTFETPEMQAALPWASISDLVQSTSRLIISADGVVSAEEPSSWPLAEIRAAAHGNGTRLWVGVHVVSKEAATELFADAASPALATAATQLASMVAAAEYDGFQLDIEALKPASKAGYEAFVAKAAAAAAAQRVSCQVTVWAPKLLANPQAPSAYNISYLAAATDAVFIMGYDMHWLHVTETPNPFAGPNAPLDGLTAALDSAASWGAPPEKLILGLPWYGRVYVCSGNPPQPGDASNCTEATPGSQDDFKKKSLEMMEPVSRQAGCFGGYDETTATPWWECPNGSGIQGLPPNTRQQGWYENAKSLQAKLKLAQTRGLLGAGAWSASGIGGGTAFDMSIWQLWEAYRAKT